jgi:hypothetical protein
MNQLPDTLPAPVCAGFTSEFVEVAEDASLQDAESILTAHPDVGRWLSDYVMDLVAVSDPEPANMIETLATGMLSLFLAGRRHALRGYRAPLPADTDGTLPAS